MPAPRRRIIGTPSAPITATTELAPLGQSREVTLSFRSTVYRGERYSRRYLLWNKTQKRTRVVLAH